MATWHIPPHVEKLWNASPDMLAALKAWQEAELRMTDADADDLYCRACDMRDAAIAKAEGRP